MLFSKFLVLFFATTAWANNPLSFTYQGQLLTSSGQASTDTVTLTLQILSPDGSCLLYEQSQTNVNVAPTQGLFSVQVGTPVASSSRTSNDPALSMPAIFSNQGTAIRNTGATNCTGGYTPAAGDVRLLRVIVAGPSGTDTLSPDQVISSAPFALSSETLQGLAPTDLVQVNSTGSNVLTQANLESIFSTANFAKLNNLLTGATPLNMNNQTVSNVANPVSAQDAATKNYSDSNIGGKSVNLTGIGSGIGGGDTLIWDAVSNHWAVGPASGLSLQAGTGLLGGTITSRGTISVDVGTTASKIVQLNAAAQLPAVDGSLLLNISAGTLQSRAVSSMTPANGQVLTWNGTSNQWQPQSGATSALTALTGDVTAVGPGAAAATISPNAITSAKINNTGIAVNQLLITDATTGGTVTYASCTIGQVMQWTATGWACASVNSVLGNSGVSAATYGSPSQIAQFNVNSQGLVTSAGNVAINFPVTSVAGRTGSVTLNASDIGGLGSAATQGVGTAAGNLVQLNGSAKLPAVDGSLLTNIVGGAAGQIQFNNGGVFSGSSNLAWDNVNQRLGIGTPAPVVPLDIVGNLPGGTNDLRAYNSSTSGSARLLVASSPSGGAGTLSLEAHAPGSTWASGQNGANDARAVGGATIWWSGTSGPGLSMASAGTLRFFTGINTANPVAAYQRMMIDNNGNIGVGTTAPQAALDIATMGSNSALIVPRDTMANRPPVPVNGMIRFNTTTMQLEAYQNGSWTSLVPTFPIMAPSTSPASPAFGFTTSPGTGIFSNTTYTVGISTNGTQRMLVDPSGNVGIGTTTPMATLDVNGTVKLGSAGTPIHGVLTFSNITASGCPSAYSSGMGATCTLLVGGSGINVTTNDTISCSPANGPASLASAVYSCFPSSANQVTVNVYFYTGSGNTVPTMWNVAVIRP